MGKAFIFDEYALAKYDRASVVRLRDVLFLSHAKPRDTAQAELWKRLIANELITPDTWEVALASGGDKRTHWERLLTERKLGALALLRNLRTSVFVKGGRKTLSLNRLWRGPAGLPQKLHAKTIEGINRFGCILSITAPKKITTPN